MRRTDLNWRGMQILAWPCSGLLQACVISVFAAPSVLASPQNSTQVAPARPVENSAYEVDRQQLLRVTTFGNREINLPMKLSNAELQIKNDKLDLDIAKLEGSEPDMDRLAIDSYLLAKRQQAISIATIFARAWSPRADQHLQLDLAPFDDKFDAAVSDCQPKDEDGKTGQFATIEDARAGCADLQEIYDHVSKLSVASPPSWPSVFAQDPLYKTRAGYALLQADLAQLKRDKALLVALKYKRILITSDENLLGADHEIWLVELSDQNVAAFNAKYPEQRMADSADLLQSLKTFHGQILAENTRYRAAIIPHPGKHR